jgi:hypothetical protein
MDFSVPVVYTVRARNGTNQPYTVTVQALKNSAKAITGFSFPAAGVLETVIGSIPGSDGRIPISVTVSQNTSLTSLVPRITHTGASISPAPGSARDFNIPVSYRVTAEDGSFNDYAVTVHVANDNAKVITGFVFRPEDNPGVSGLTVPVVGSIDQDVANTIRVVLPLSLGSSIPTGLKPHITYIGASITPQGGSEDTAHNPFTDSERNFNSPFIYTVTAADDTAQDYTVRVSLETRNQAFSVTFLAITDPRLISESFDQSTGIVSIGLDTTDTDYHAPYEWYLDGKKLSVSSVEPGLELHTGGLLPGEHEVVVIMTKTVDPLFPGYPTSYTNKVSFWVHE